MRFDYSPRTELLAPRSFLKNIKTWQGFNSKKEYIWLFLKGISRTSPSTQFVPMLMKNKFKKKKTEATLPKTVPDAMHRIRKRDKLEVCFCSSTSLTGMSPSDFETKAEVSLSSSFSDTAISKETVTTFESNEWFCIWGAHLQAVKKPAKEMNAAGNLWMKSVGNKN